MLDGEYRQFEAKLDGLEPDTVYCYRVAGLTEPAGFRTAPAPGESDTIRFAAIGDSGTGDSFQRAVAEQRQSVPYEFLLHLGDLAYGSGQPDEVERKTPGGLAANRLEHGIGATALGRVAHGAGWT